MAAILRILKILKIAIFFTLVKFLSNIVLKYQASMCNKQYSQNLALLIMLIRLIILIAISNIHENKHLRDH